MVESIDTKHCSIDSVTEFSEYVEDFHISFSGDTPKTRTKYGVCVPFSSFRLLEIVSQADEHIEIDDRN
jgi:hypothetical protein